MARYIHAQSSAARGTAIRRAVSVFTFSPTRLCATPVQYTPLKLDRRSCHLASCIWRATRIFPDLAAGATAFLFHRPPGQLCPSSRELKCRFISAAEPSATRPSPQHLDPALWCSISKPNRSLDSAQSYLLPSGVLLSQHRRQRPRLLSDPIFAQYRIEDEINDDFGVFPCSGDTGVYRMRLQLDPSVLASQQIGVIESRTAATLKLRCRKTVPGVTPRVIDAGPSTSSSPDQWYKVLIA